MWLVGGFYGRGYQEIMGMVIRKWVWLECIGVVSGCV